jgi:hypothetical protein
MTQNISKIKSSKKIKKYVNKKQGASLIIDLKICMLQHYHILLLVFDII